MRNVPPLVCAVVAAEREDELDWIEWKIAGDLTKRPTQGTVARHILGMANRMPDRAAQRHAFAVPATGLMEDREAFPVGGDREPASWLRDCGTPRPPGLCTPNGPGKWRPWP